MPIQGAEGSGAQTVQAEGPGSTHRGPLYLKTPPVAGQPAGSFTYTKYMDTKGEWALMIHTVTIPSVTLKTTHSAPIDLSTLDSVFGAPGAGNIIQVDFIVAELVYGAATYANGGALTVTYGSGGPAAHATAIPAALVTAAQTEVFMTAGGLSAQNTGAAVVNIGLFLAAASADFITGDGTLMLKIGYRVLQGF